MTTTLGNIADHKKAHANSTGFLELINSFDAATQEWLAGDNVLLNLYSIDQVTGLQHKLLQLDSNITITTGDKAGEIAPTASTIGLVLSNNLGAPVSLISMTPNSSQKPLITDTSTPCAFIIGTLDPTRDLIAIDDLEAGMKLAHYLINDNVTVLVSPNKGLFNSTVRHFADIAPVTIFMTIDNKDKICQPLAGMNVQAVITTFDILLMLENGTGLASVLTDDDTQSINLQSEAWGEPELLANDPSKPTTYPINAFTGLLRQVIEAVAYYAQVPLAMAAQCVLGALAHMGQRFIDAPMGHGHMPASLILITEGESGSGKTQAMGLTHFKIAEYERQQYQQYLQDIEIWETDKAGLKGNEIAAYKENNPMPKNPKTMFKEATIEPILDMFISEQINNASWTTDEAGQFFNGHTMKGDTAGSALSSLTTLYSDGTVSRVRSQKSAYATPRTDAYDVRMTLLLQGQRVVLEPALTDPLMNEQGFLARALIACPEDLRGKRVWNDEKRNNDSPYDNRHLIEYWSRCHALLDPLPANLPNDATGAPQRIKIQWADKHTKQTFNDLAQAIEDRQAKGQALEYLKAYASRMAENASRIASLMAFFEGRKVITIDDITRAFMLVEYSTAERLRYLDATPTGEQNDSEKLSNWLVDKARDKKPPILNKSFVSQNAPNALRGKKLNALLDDLESMGHVRLESEGRRRLVCINPKLINK